MTRTMAPVTRPTVAVSPIPVAFEWAGVALGFSRSGGRIQLPSTGRRGGFGGKR